MRRVKWNALNIVDVNTPHHQLPTYHPGHSNESDDSFEHHGLPGQIGMVVAEQIFLEKHQRAKQSIWSHY